MANSKNNPGNANLPIGGERNAIQENGGPRGGQRNAIQENGGPKSNCQPANRENGVPRWHSRGYLPHFESGGATQHVTFHLADSLPQTVLLRLQAALKFLPAEKRDVELRKRVEAWIDAGHGSCILRKPGIADMVQGSLLIFDSQRYRLLEWVVMPNHVHVLFQPMNGWTVAKIVASWKKFTARKICDYLREGANREIGDPGSAPVWHREYWDRYIRDQRHFDQAIGYIQQNPVKAGLAIRAESWRWSSAYSGNAGILKVRGGANREIGGPGGKR